MAVRVKSRQVVKPAEPTWNGILSLSELDQIGVITHSTGIYFYNAPANVTHDGINPINNKSIASTLRDSLSRVLVPFYPLAGRLHWIEGGRLELECNAKGVEFIEAESSKKISDFGDFSSANFKDFQGLVPSVDYGKPIQEIPLFLVQFTRFRCGGFSVASSFSHSVVDGQGIFHFTIEWARLARGDSMDVPPYIDRTVVQDRDQHCHSLHNREEVQNVDDFSRLPRLMGESNEENEGNKNDYGSHKAKAMVDLVATMSPLSRSQVQKLRKAANRGLEYDCRPYGRFEAIAAHIWRCVCKARGLKAEQLTALCFTVDSRDRMDPPLPPRYFGNAIVDVVATSRVGELTLKPLNHVCSKIRETRDKVTNEYICSTIDFFKRQSNLSKYQDRVALGSTEGIFYGNPNLGFASWLNLPICGLDFGYGKEIFMGPGCCEFDGDIMILPGYNEIGSVLVAIGLQGSHMEKFKKCFYEDIDELEFGQKMVL